MLWILLGGIENWRILYGNYVEIKILETEYKFVKAM
jgi:hypothetical protein